jgi:hypothetical protein
LSLTSCDVLIVSGADLQKVLRNQERMMRDQERMVRDQERIRQLTLRDGKTESWFALNQSTWCDTCGYLAHGHRECEQEDSAQGVLRLALDIDGTLLSVFHPPQTPLLPYPPHSDCHERKAAIAEECRPFLDHFDLVTRNRVGTVLLQFRPGVCQFLLTLARHPSRVHIHIVTTRSTHSAHHVAFFLQRTFGLLITRVLHLQRKRPAIFTLHPSAPVLIFDDDRNQWGGILDESVFLFNPTQFTFVQRQLNSRNLTRSFRGRPCDLSWTPMLSLANQFADLGPWLACRPALQQQLPAVVVQTIASALLPAAILQQLLPFFDTLQADDLAARTQRIDNACICPMCHSVVQLQGLWLRCTACGALVADWEGTSSSSDSEGKQ